MNAIALRIRPVAYLGLTLLLVATLGLLPACTSSSLGGERTEAEDNAARVEYFESAAVTYYDGARYDLAEKQFRRVLAIQPNNKKARRGLAKSLYHQGTYPKLVEAQAIFEKIVPLDWTHAELGNRRFEVQTDLALTYSDLADLFDRDIRDIRRRQAKDPTADQEDLEEWVRKQVARRNELLLKAIPTYREVLRQSPDNPYALAGLGKSHLQLGNDDLGIHFSKRYLELSQKSQLGWKTELNKWETTVGGSGNVTDEQRREFIMKIQGAREKEKKMHLMLASVHMRREEFGPAIEEYTAVIKLDAAVPAAYVERAQAFAALRQYRKAVDDLEEYLKITDPQMHREQRLSAVELLDRYQGAMLRQGAPAPPPRAPGYPSSNPPRR